MIFEASTTPYANLKTDTYTLILEYLYLSIIARLASFRLEVILDIILIFIRILQLLFVFDNSATEIRMLVD